MSAPCLVHPTIGEREVVAALLERNHRLIRDGQIYGGRTPSDVFARVAQRLLAMAAGIRHNWTKRLARLDLEGP